jgi:GMP synthase (glutamine-hydrolysing)
MRVHYLQHVPFEDSANIGTWAQSHNHSLTNTKLYEGEPFPDITDIDMLAIMGGPMNIYQYRDYPWLKDEKLFIEQAINKKVKIIGVCLGAQLIADVLGAKIIQNSYVEIGWYDVILTEAGENSNLLKDFPKTFTAFHWHGDTFEIPPDAKHLAGNDTCINQAFQYNDNVIGLQFHLEYALESIEKMLENCDDELIEAPYVQQKEQIKQGYYNINYDIELLNSLLDGLCA